MKTIQYQATCPNCGAPITTEICPYCNSATGIDTASANMDYPLLECKPATIDFWSVGFPTVFAVSFGFFCFFFPFFMHKLGNEDMSMVLLLCVPFMLVGLGSAIIVIRKLLRYFALKAKGKKITATVYGYMDDTFLINNMPAQVVKLLVETSHGKRFILYKTGKTTQPYGINTNIELAVYKDFFLIEKNKETVFD